MARVSSPSFSMQLTQRLGLRGFVSFERGVFFLGVPVDVVLGGLAIVDAFCDAFALLLLGVAATFFVSFVAAGASCCIPKAFFTIVPNDINHALISKLLLLLLPVLLLSLVRRAFLRGGNMVVT